jgi:hypothetical protein
VAELALERLVDVPILVIRASGRAAVGPEVLEDSGALWGKAVLVHTGWSRHWGTLHTGPELLTSQGASLRPWSMPTWHCSGSTH